MASIIQPKARYGFTRETGSGKTERFVNSATGESISRRQFDKLRREKTLGEKLSNEKLAKLNKQVEPLKAAARPARGRQSVQKLAPDTRADIARARIENEKALKLAEKNRQEQAKVERSVYRAQNKTVKRKKITARLLRPGHTGARIAFNDYDEYLEAFGEGKRTGKIFAYGLGWEGVDARDGRRKDITVFRLRVFDRPIGEDEFQEMMDDSVEEKSYMVFTNYWMHLAFSQEFAARHASTSKQARKKRK